MLGKYRLVAELARGGMGVAHLALLRRPGATSKLFVLKELKPELLEEPAVLTMFMQEARLAARLHHPNVVRTFEAGSDGHRRFIAMEYLDGQPLHRVLSCARRGGKTMPLEFQGAVLCSALEGLAYAHTALDGEGRPMGLVHRDVSPHNVFVCYDGQVKVLDFGIAKALNSWIDTRTGVLKGKVPYMSPEHAAGQEVDARADVFAVGVILWEAATGRRFWTGAGDVEILRTMSEGRFPADHDGAMDDVHEGLRAVVEKATALDPSRRYASALELLAELRAALGKGRGPRWGPREIGRFVEELFTDDRARLQAAIKEALNSQTQTVSGKYRVSDLRSRSVPPEPFDATTLMGDVVPASEGPLSLPQLPLPQSRSTKPPPLPTLGPAALREKLLASGGEIALSASRLHESVALSALPQAAEALGRAGHAAVAYDVAATREVVSDCMDVVQAFERWRLSVTDYLRSPEPSECVTELDFESSEALPPATRASLESVVPLPPFTDSDSSGLGPVEAAQKSDRLQTAPPQHVTRELRPIAGGLLGLLAVLVAALWVLAVRRAPELPPALATQAASPPMAFPPSDRPIAEEVRVIVRASPPQSRIVIDGRLAFENPSALMLPKDEWTHTLRVEADGYLPRDESFDAKGDRTFVLVLEPLEGPSRPGSGPRAVAPLVAPARLPAASGATAPADKGNLGPPQKNHGPADDVRPVPRASPSPHERDEML